MIYKNVVFAGPHYVWPCAGSAVPAGAKQSETAKATEPQKQPSRESKAPLKAILHSAQNRHSVGQKQSRKAKKFQLKKKRDPKKDQIPPTSPKLFYNQLPLTKIRGN